MPKNTKNKTRTCNVETLTGSKCTRRIGKGENTCFQHHHATGKKTECKVPKNTKNVSWSENISKQTVPKTEPHTRKGLHLVKLYQMSEKDQEKLWDCAVYTLGEHDIWERDDYMSAIRSNRFSKRQKTKMRNCAKFLGWIN